MTAATRIYFASDMHLGAPNPESSLAREKRLVRWLKEVGEDATEIHLLGDVLDFWFEYGKAVPKGFVRLFGTLAELSDRGVGIYWYLGNHDMWLFDYLPEELGVKVLDGPVERVWGDKRFYIAHGDGLGPGDHAYKFLKKVFRNRLCQWLFARIHPNLGIRIAQFFSSSSRTHSVSGQSGGFLGDDKEWLMIHSREVHGKDPHDYYVYGHRHLPMMKELKGGGCYVNLGDWIHSYSYGLFDGEKFQLLTYSK